MLPPQTAEATSGILMSRFIAIGKAITDMIAMVPIEVPVANESRHDIMNTSTGRSAGIRNCSKMLERYVPVPRALTIGDSVKANIRIAAMESMLEQPLKILSIN